MQSPAAADRGRLRSLLLLPGGADLRLAAADKVRSYFALSLSHNRVHVYFALIHTIEPSLYRFVLAVGTN